MTVMIKEIPNIYYVPVDNAVLPESLTIDPPLFPFPLLGFLAKTIFRSLFHQYELILTLDSAG